MNYEKIYNDLCNSRRSRGLSKEDYFEIHHIKPRSFGGSDHKGNLVKLTLREHFVAHKLLEVINRKDKERYCKMVSALWLMSHTEGRKNILSSREYDNLKRKWRVVAIPKIIESTSHRQKIFRTQHRKYGVDIDLLKEFNKIYVTNRKTKTLRIKNLIKEFGEGDSFTLKHEGFITLCITIMSLGYEGISTTTHEVNMINKKFSKLFHKKVNNGKVEYLFTDKFINLQRSHSHLSQPNTLLKGCLGTTPIKGGFKFLKMWNKNFGTKLLYYMSQGRNKGMFLPVSHWEEDYPYFVRKTLNIIEMEKVNKELASGSFNYLMESSS